MKRHILLRKYAGNNALVTVTTRHLVADGDLTFLSDVYADEFVYAGRKFVFVRAGKYFDVYYDTAFAVRNFKRSIADFPCLFAEYRAEKSFFGGKFGFALRGDFTDENIAAVDFRADTYDTVFVEVFKRVVADVRNIARDLFFAEFRIARFDFVFFDMNGGEYVLSYEFFGKKDRVLVVITFPAHEADENVSAEREFAVFGGRTVRDDLTFRDLFALIDDRTAG